jgi:CTP synthase (UTP-ammonia lyase)
VKKAKVDAIIKRKAAEAATRARYEGQSEGRAQARKEFELLLVPPDDGTGVCVIGEQPKHRHFIVAIHPRYTPRIADPGTLDSYMMRDMEYRRAIFEPVMRCQLFGTGQRVVWYDYQFRGLQ